MSEPNSVQELLNKANINKKITKWLPRLQDPGTDVRARAAEILSELALNEAELRDSLLPLLLKHCVREKSWVVICNSILFHIASIAESESEWVEAFLSTYIHLSRVHDNDVDPFSGPTIREHAFDYIYDLIKARKIKRDHPKMRVIISAVSAGLSKTEGEGAGENRLAMMNIKDWYDDD